MTLWELFFSGLFFENIVTWYAIGVSAMILFSYTMEEAFAVSIRIICIMMFQSAFLYFLNPFFQETSFQIILLIILIGTGICGSILIDRLIPSSHLEDSIQGFTKRGDAWIPFMMAIILSKNYHSAEVFFYGLGLSLGLCLTLFIITSISIMFNFHRLHPRHQYTIKLLLLSILSLLSY